MLTALLLLLAGVVLAWLGGTLFVDGSVGLARWARWPTSVVGVTMAAFGTSSPELMVAIQAARDGLPQISLGDVLGSNVVNIALVLAIVLSFSSMKVEDSGVRRDWAWALSVPFVMMAILWDGWFSRIDALILMSLFSVWLIVVVRHALRHRASSSAPSLDSAPFSLSKIAPQVIVGLAVLGGAAELVVRGGKGIAEALGWSPFVVGAVIVAAATSTPELATTVVSRMRGHHDVGLGNILGSNIFNALLIASVAAAIQPYRVRPMELIPSLLFGAVATLFILPGRQGHLGRWRGVALLALYVVFIFSSLQGSPHS